MTHPLRAMLEWLAPEETVARSALPLTLLVRPGPMLALVALGVNDHLLKGSGWLPGWMTGKISDFAGLLYFPLLLVTLLNLALHPLERWRGRPLPGASPTVRQIDVACVATGLFFGLVQVVPEVADFYSWATAKLAFWSRATSAVVTMDPTDLVAVPSVVVAAWWGRRAVARLPPGRLLRLRCAVQAGAGPLTSREAAAQAGVGDVWPRLDGAGQRHLAALAEALRAGDDAAAEQALAALRG